MNVKYRMERFRICSIYDFILKDMNIFDKKIINVPHPYFFNLRKLDLRTNKKF